MMEVTTRVFWERTDGPGLERCELARAPAGWVLRGTLLTREDTGPARGRLRGGASRR